MSIFNEERFFLNGSLNDEIHFFKISDLNIKLKEIIDDYITEICHPKKYYTTIDIVKKDLLKGLEGIEDSNLFMGRISEFFIHIYLKYYGFKPQFIFTNLEENTSIKKGFDGYYCMGNEEWVMESKSGNLMGNSHEKKVKKAYNGLSDMFSGLSKDKKGNPINPWQNAYHHASIVSSKDTLLSKINKLSIDFKSDNFTDIKEYNVIPSSTIFLDDEKCYDKSIIDNTYIKNKINTWLSDKSYNKIIILCITHKTKKVFLEYLKS